MDTMPSSNASNRLQSQARVCEETSGAESSPRKPFVAPQCRHERDLIGVTGTITMFS